MENVIHNITGVTIYQESSNLENCRLRSADGQYIADELFFCFSFNMSSTPSMYIGGHLELMWEIFHELILSFIQSISCEHPD